MVFGGIKKIFKKSSDGTQNEEHILDIINAIKVKYENMQENTDISIKTIENEMAIENRDYDVVDAIILLGQEVVEYEKKAREVMDEIEEIERSITNNEKVDQEMVQTAFDNIRDYEKLSKNRLETIIRACEDSKRERRKHANQLNSNQSQEATDDNALTKENSNIETKNTDQTKKIKVKNKTQNNTQDAKIKKNKKKDATSAKEISKRTSAKEISKKTNESRLSKSSNIDDKNDKKTPKKQK